MKLFSLLFIISLFLGCQDKAKDTSLHQIHWDRDMCQRCKMVVSERKYAVQAINPKTSKSYMFDDIGCLILWFKDEQIAWEKEAIIYIADAKSGKMIDAKKAYYDIGSTTPMDYGFSAYQNKDDIRYKNDIINYDDVRLKILRGESMQNPLIKQKIQG